MNLKDNQHLKVRLTEDGGLRFGLIERVSESTLYCVYHALSKRQLELARFPAVQLDVMLQDLQRRLAAEIGKASEE